MTKFVEKWFVSFVFVEGKSEEPLLIAATSKSRAGKLAKNRLVEIYQRRQRWHGKPIRFFVESLTYKKARALLDAEYWLRVDIEEGKATNDAVSLWDCLNPFAELAQVACEAESQIQNRGWELADLWSVQLGNVII